MTYGQPPGGGYGPQGQPPQQWGGYGQSGGYSGGAGGYSPGYGAGGAPMQAPPQNYLVWAIISLFLCWPFAIPAIIFANQVNQKFNMGDYPGAQESARKAKMYALIATIAGPVLWILFWIFYIIVIAASFHAATSNPYG